MAKRKAVTERTRESMLADGFVLVLAGVMEQRIARPGDPATLAVMQFVSRVVEEDAALVELTVTTLWGLRGGRSLPRWPEAPAALESKGGK